MKWYENGVEFEGTPQEYAQLLALQSGVPGGAGVPQLRKPRVYVNPRSGRSVRCTGSAGHRDFVSAKLAWEYTRQQTGINIGYSCFCDVANKGGSIGPVKVEYTAPATRGLPATHAEP